MVYPTNLENPGSAFVNPRDRFWSLYLDSAEAEDRARAENWKGDTDGILIFTGLFAATVAAFVIESYKQLSPDSSVQTIALLGQISAQLNGSTVHLLAPVDIFTPPATAVVANTFWFMSLVTSIICALSATLVQQWTRAYLRDVQRRRSIQKRGLVHIFLCIGVERFHLDQASAWIVMLLHLSVALFMAGLVTFLIPINLAVAYTSLGVICVAVTAYFVLSILPVLSVNCPYRTPLTPVITLAVVPIAAFLSSTAIFISRVLSQWRQYPETVLLDRVVVEPWAEIHGSAKELSREKAAAREDVPLTFRHLEFALKRVSQDADEIHELETFLDSLPPLLDSLVHVLFPPDLRRILAHLHLELHILQRITLLVDSVVRTNDMLEHARVRRLSIALTAAHRFLACFAAVAGHDLVDVPGISRCCQELFDAWSVLLQGNDPESLLARIHVATFRSSLCKTLRILPMPPWNNLPLNGWIAFLLQHLDDLHPVVPVHDTECCITNSRPGEFSQPLVSALNQHLPLSNALTLIRDLLKSPRNIVDLLSSAWVPLIDEIPLIEPPSPLQPASKALEGIFVEAGLDSWLMKEFEFSLSHGDPSTELLSLYPQLSTGMRMITDAVVPAPSVSESQHHSN